MNQFSEMDGNTSSIPGSLLILVSLYVARCDGFKGFIVWSQYRAGY